MCRWADSRGADSIDELTPQLRRHLHGIVRDGKRAKIHLLEANLPLVVPVAAHHTGYGIPLSDLIQEGNLGLVRAVEQFDYTESREFSLFATWRVRHAIIRAVADQARAIRVPVRIVKWINKLGRTRQDLSQVLGREPTSGELAIKMGISREEVVEIQRYARKMVSLDQILGEEGDLALGDSIHDSETFNTVDAVSFTLLHDQLRSVLTALTKQEANVIRLKFGLGDDQPLTLDEISQTLRINRECIRRIETTAMTKLRYPSHLCILRVHLN